MKISCKSIIVILFAVILGGTSFVHASITTTTVTVTGTTTDNTYPTNDIWDSMWQNTVPAIVSLNQNDTFVANINISPGITAEDWLLNDDESIHIGINGEGGVGGSNTVDYKFWFTDVTGSLSTGTQANPITGSLTINGTTGNVDFNRNLELTSSSFSFKDIHFELTYTGTSVWSFDKFKAGMDADNIVPEPATLCLFGLGGLLLRRRKSA